jgi:hypothetical protein
MFGRWFARISGASHEQHIARSDSNATRCQQSGGQREPGRSPVIVAVRRSQTGFTSGATYDTQTIAGQTKATLNSAVNATKSLLHIK